jgi:2-(1,2-epoxy-1,2-dihydrophenyl)acetyl-CoA isomerase
MGPRSPSRRQTRRRCRNAGCAQPFCSHGKAFHNHPHPLITKMANIINLSRTDDIAILTMSNNEQANTIDMSFCEGLLKALNDVRSSRHPRAVVLRGEGSLFSAGGDLGQILERLDKGVGSLAALIGAFHTVILAIRDLHVPVVASVQGPAAGAGFSLAMACDAVVAVNSAKFVVGYPRLGTSSDGGLSFQLARRLGPARALEIFLRKEPLNAEEACLLGLVQRVTDAASLDDTALELAKMMSSYPSAAVTEIKSLIGTLSDDGLEQHLEREKLAFLRCASTPEFRTSVAHFVQQSTARKRR